MWHISEIQTILDSNYIAIDLSIYVKFSLGKWLGTRQKSIQKVHKKLKHSCSQIRDQKYYLCISR